MTSTGETSLTKLLETLSVTVSPSSYTFLTLPSSHCLPFHIPPNSPGGIQMLFREPTEDQWTLIIDSSHGTTISTYQELGAECSPTHWKMLTLNVQSSLDAVGFMAVVARALTDADVSANVVAAYLHDHIFVQAEKAESAMAAIEQVAKDARAQRGS